MDRVLGDGRKLLSPFVLLGYMKVSVWWSCLSTNGVNEYRRTGSSGFVRRELSTGQSPGVTERKPVSAVPAHVVPVTA